MSRIRLIHLLWAVALLAGCYRWSEPRPAPRSALESRPAKVLVDLSDGSQRVLVHPRIQGDSLISDSWDRFGDPVPVALPLTDVVRVREREFSLGRTGLLVLGIPVFAALIGGLILLFNPPHFI